MDLDRMLERCRREQWKLEDLDWDVTPRALSRHDEEKVVQYFVDMSGIERLAGALFAVQRDQATDPTLRAIFETFVEDEARHAEVAARLSRHYDVHRYRRYAPSPYLRRFSRHFVKAARHLTPDVAASYITTGELLLDIALLRSLDAFVDDEMSHRAMALINRDESRHIAVDYHMIGYYASPAFDRELAARPPRRLRDEARAAAALAGMLFWARPFFRDVFFGPMDLVDPSGKRLLDAFKRIQLLGARVGDRKRSVMRTIDRLVRLYNDPRLGPWLGPALERATGLDGRVMRDLYTAEEERRARQASYDALADEALAAKHAD